MSHERTSAHLLQAAEATSLVQDCEVLFGCIDSLIGRSELEVFARRSMIPLIDIGMDVQSRGGHD